MYLKRPLLWGLFVAFVLSGCTATPTIYQWDNYQSVVYQHFKKSDSSPEEQIAALEKIIIKAQAKDKLVAPGVHAHLGMLYAQTGKLSEATAQFELEKQLFPESEPFMVFLIKNQQRNAQ